MNDAKIEKLRSKDYRRSYLASHTRLGMTHQLRLLRNARKWSQQDLADRLGKKQHAVSRLEDPQYSRMSVQTALELADALGVALVFRFVSWGSFLEGVEHLSPDALTPRSFEDEFGTALTTARLANAVIPIGVNITDQEKQLGDAIEITPPSAQVPSAGTTGFGAVV